MRGRRVTRLLLSALCAACCVAGAGAIRPAVASASINVVLQRQIYALDCEAAALQIALSAEGITISQDWALQEFGADLRGQVRANNQPVRWGDPYQTFVGDVSGSFTVTGYGVYYPPIVAAAEAAGATAVGHEHWSPGDLYAAVNAGNPVIVRVPHLLRPAGVGYWTAWDGRSIWYSPSDHAQVLVGADIGAGTVTLADPLDGQLHSFPMPLFEARFAAFMSQAVVISMAASGPRAAVTPDNAQQDLVWRGASNHLMESVYAGGWTGPVDVTTTALHGAAPLASDPSVLEPLDNSGQEVFWRGPSDHLYEASSTGGGWQGPTDLTATAFGGAGLLRSAPSATVTTAGTRMVFWQGEMGHLDEAWFSGGRWNGPVDWTAARFGEGALVVTSPTVAVLPDGTQMVFWEDSSGHLEEAWYAGGWNGPVDWTAARFGGAASLGSAPTAAVTPGGAAQVIFWEGLNGQLDEAWFTAGQWNGPVDMTSGIFGGAVTLTSAPAVAVTPAGVQVLFWRRTTQDLMETWFSAGRWNGPVTVPKG